MAGGQGKHYRERNNTINQENCKRSSAWALWRRSPRHDWASSEESQLSNRAIQPQ